MARIFESIGWNESVQIVLSLVSIFETSFMFDTWNIETLRLVWEVATLLEDQKPNKQWENEEFTDLPILTVLYCEYWAEIIGYLADRLKIDGNHVINIFGGIFTVTFYSAEWKRRNLVQGFSLEFFFLSSIFSVRRNWCREILGIPRFARDQTVFFMGLKTHLNEFFILVYWI